MSNTWTELDLTTLCQNIRRVRRSLSSGKEIIFVVKSNAYGHGAIPVSEAACRCGVRWLAVAHLHEALEIRRKVKTCDILVLGGVDPARTGDAIRNKITPVIVSERHALALAREARRLGKTLTCHAKLDTGMGRLGLPWETAAESLSRIVQAGGLRITGACMHFASAAGTPDNFAETQWQRFHTVLGQCEANGLHIKFRHCSNSAAFFTHPEWDLDAVRTGLVLYGYSPAQYGDRVITKPIFQWKTRILQVKKVPAGFRVGYYSTYVTREETHIATINAGYSDGYSRRLSNKGLVLIEGRRCPVVGRVTMNFICVDLGAHTRAKEGDEVVLLGRQKKESIWAGEIAKRCATIPYEIFTSIRTADRRIV